MTYSCDRTRTTSRTERKTRRSFYTPDAPPAFHKMRGSCPSASLLRRDVDGPGNEALLISAWDAAYLDIEFWVLFEGGDMKDDAEHDGICEGVFVCMGRPIRAVCRGGLGQSDGGGCRKVTCGTRREQWADCPPRPSSPHSRLSRGAERYSDPGLELGNVVLTC